MGLCHFWGLEAGAQCDDVTPLLLAHIHVQAVVVEPDIVPIQLARPGETQVIVEVVPEPQAAADGLFSG